MKLAPIVIFAFDRPAEFKRLLSSLTCCRLFFESEVYIFVDGPRNSLQDSAVQDVIALSNSLEHSRKNLIVRERNFGLKTSLRDGISSVLASHETVIVIEDDLVVSPDILVYFNDALNKYSSERSVFSICADFPLEAMASNKVGAFLPHGSSWGWATWRDRWQEISFDIASIEVLLQSRDFRRRLNGFGLRDFYRMLRDEQEGIISSWFVYWQLTIARNSGVSLFPPHPLISNLGFSNGTHGGRFNLFTLFGHAQKTIGKYDFQLPENVNVDWRIHNAFVSSSEWRLLRINSVLGRLKRRGLAKFLLLRRLLDSCGKFHSG